MVRRYRVSTITKRTFSRKFIIRCDCFLPADIIHRNRARASVCFVRRFLATEKFDVRQIFSSEGLKWIRLLGRADVLN